MPVTFLDEEPKPEVSAQPKTGGITFIDETPTVQNPIPEATPYTYGTDPIVDKTLDENKANWEKIGMSVFSEQELADIKAKGPINFFEAAGRDAEWPIYDMTKNSVFAAQLAKRMAMGEELSDGENEQLKKILRHQAEGEIRGYSAPSWYGPGGYVGSGLVQSATFGAELAASAGVGRLAVGTAAKIGTKVAVEEAGKLFVKKTLARKASEMTAAGVIFTGMNFAEKYGERRLNQFVTITDKGDAFFKQSKETPFTSALMVAGNLGVEYGSELSGGALAAGAKYVSAPAVKMLSPYTEAAAKTLIDKVPAKIKDALFMAYRGINKNATVSNVFSAAGWHGMLAELGEERVADVMKFALNIDDKEGYTFEQAMNAIYPGPEQILVEAGIIGITGGSIAAMNGAANTLASVSEKYGMTRPEAEKMMNSLSQTEIDNLAKEIGTKGIKTQVQQVEGAAFDLARKSGVAEEEARAWSKVAAAQSLWGSKTYGIGPSKYFESLKIGIDNTNPPPMTEKAYKSMMRLEPDYTGGEKLPYQNTIDQLREIQRKSDQKFERYNRAVEKVKAEGRVYKGAKVSRDLPILKYLKKKGGVLIGSPLAAELETMGITSKSEPWLFRKEDARVGTAQGVVTVPALRNLDQIEPKDISDKTGKVFNAIGTSETDTSGNYADPAAILEAIDNEYRNLSAPKDSADNAWADDMERILGEAGVSLSNTDEEINIALMNYERAMNAGRDNTYYQSSKIDRMSPSDLSNHLSDKYSIDVAIGKSGDILVLSAIKVPEGERGSGIGTKAMKEIINYADKKGLSIALTPTSDFGGNKSRLEKWYKSFGFVENKGKNKDFSTRERFIRSPKKLYQDNRASVQFMQNGKKIITLMAGADRSSLLHETGHIFLRELEAAAGESDIASEHLKTVREFVGAKEGEAFTREQEEVFARGFERYLMEGHAPNNFLKDAFESFREWLIEIYQSVMGLDVPMNNEMREVYDALLGGRDLDIYFRPVKIDNHESAWAKFYRYTFDDLAPIHRAVKVAQGIRGKFPDGTNPEWIARLFASSKGRLIENLQNQTYYLDENGNPVITGEGFKPILEDYDTEFARHEPEYETRFNDLQEYMIAQRYLADLSNKEGVTVTEEQKEYSVKTLQRLNNKYGETAVRLPSYAQRIYDFQARILENLVRSGLMSKSDYDGILNGNKHYIPFQRVFEEGEIEEHPFVVGGRGRFISASNPVKSIKGSTRDVKDPFSQIIINTARVLHAAEKNRVMASIAAMSAYLPEEIKPTKQPMTKIVLDDGSVTYRPNGKPKGNVIEYKTDGKRHFVEVSLPMYEALQGMHPVQANLLERFMSGIASFFRAAATLPPDFWIRNFIRDVNSASVQSTHGIKPIDVVKGILAVGEKNDLYNEWMQSGGSFNSYMELDDKGAEKALQELISPKGRMMRYIKSGGIELLKDASGAVEQATRIAMYNRARESGESGMMAALQSRDGTLDFSRAGKWGRVANRYIPFLNAGLQGTDRLIRAFKSHPGLMTWRAFTTITAPSIAITGYYLYMAPDDERKEYLEIPQWQKDLFWCFKSNGTWWRIPKPFALGYAFGSVPERFMLWAYHGDKPEAEGIFREVVLGLGGSLSPIQDIGTLMTPVGRIIVESTSNYNFFTGRSIYPEWLDMKPAEERATKYQSETALLLGEVSGQSPAIIENAIRGMLATSTPYVLGAGDGIINAVKEWNGENVPEKPMTPSDKMFIRGFSVRSPEGYRSVSSNNFFEKWTEIKQRHASWNGKEGPEKEEYMKKYGSTIRLYKPMKDFYNRMDKLNDQIDSIYDNKAMSGPEKLRQIEPLEKQITEIAREANSWYLKNKE